MQPWAPSCSSPRLRVVAGAAFAGGNGFVGWHLCSSILCGEVGQGLQGTAPPLPAPPLRKLPRLQALWRGNGSHRLCSWCLIIAQRRHFGFIAFIYYKKSSVCFLKQLSGQIVVDKQCWSVFLRQPKFITFHLFIYFAKLWWCHVFFFK